ncbi:MAG: adenine phosphoribosyltransferase [Propionibacteriaceae bacterium]|nr:adenine phosphoribosyltransferase [Propionibacteriaceae bacterium]
MPANVERVKSLIRNIPDFPKPGIQFKDITPLLGSPRGFCDAMEAMLEASPQKIDAVAGIESRGFIFSAPMALMLHVGLVPIRKPGKLPGTVFEQSFDLEYGSSTLAMHQDALQPGQRVLLVDDLLASGGTLIAAAKLIERAGAIVAHTSVLIELIDLGGRQAMADAGLTSVSSILTY